MANKFKSSSIQSLQDFEDYLKVKGYKPKSLAERPDDGYYALLDWRLVKGGDFTQIMLRKAHWNSGALSPLAPTNDAWVRLSFKDCTNPLIINS